MIVPLLDLKAQYATLRERIRASVDEVLETQRFVLGPHGAALEQEVARFCRVSHAVAVASGTDALLLSLRALGVGPGDAVITVPYTFFATAGAIANLGARPLFVDIQPSSYNMDPDRVRDLLKQECTFDKTTRRLIHKSSGMTLKAIVPVHLYGQCADMEEIKALADDHGLPIVEDCAQALGAQYRGQYAGAMGSYGCFSFFPSKNLGGAGDGGMVVTSDSALAERIQLLHVHGAATRYHHTIVGYNSRLDEIQAAVLRVKLTCLAEWNQARARNAEAYRIDFQAAGVIGRVVPPARAPDRTHIYHQYVIRAEQRNDLQTFLKERGIGTEVYYPVPLHEQECFRWLGYSQDSFPRSSAAARETLALPVYPELSDNQRQHVVASIAEFYRARG